MSQSKRCRADCRDGVGGLLGGSADAHGDRSSAITHAHGCVHREARRDEYPDAEAYPDGHADTAHGDAAPGYPYRVRRRV
jgi:hypothetical protein